MAKGKKYVYICGNAKSSNGGAVGSVYENFAVELVIDMQTEIIKDASCVLITELGRNFVKSLLVNKHIIKDFDRIISDIEECFLGINQKALITALKVAFSRYQRSKNGSQVRECIDKCTDSV